MKIFYSGAENSEWRRMLAREGADTISMSYVGLTKRLKLARPWTIRKHFAEGMHILLDSGGYSFNRVGAEVTEEDAMDLAVRYMAFVADNIDDVELVTEFDANILGRDWLEAMREDFYAGLPRDKFVPIWHDETGIPELRRLAERFPHVGVLSAGLDDTSTAEFNNLVSRFGVKLVGLGVSKTELIQAVKWHAVSSGAWLRPGIDGATVVWDGNTLHWYPAKYKEQSRKRHRTTIERSGFDAQAVIDDNRTEVIRLSLWSWQQFAASVNKGFVLNPFNDLIDVPRGVTHADGDDKELNGEQGGAGVDPRVPPSGNGRLLPVVVEPREHTLLPVIGISVLSTPGDDGEDVEERLITTSARNLMQCSTCYVKDLCPKAVPGAECAYEFPVEIITKNQLRRVQDWTIEVQTKRVGMMMLIEQLEGGNANSALSAEIDRLARLIKVKQDSEKTGFSVHVEGHGDAGTGAVSRFFGKSAGDAATRLERPVHTAEVLEGSLPVDAEIVSEEE